MNKHWIDRCHRITNLIREWNDSCGHRGLARAVYGLDVSDSLIAMGMYESAFFAYDWDCLQGTIPGVGFIRQRDHYMKALRNE